MEFIKEQNLHSIRKTDKWIYHDNLFAVEIYQVWGPEDEWNYKIVLEFDRDVLITTNGRKVLKKLTDAKSLVVKIFELLHRANSNGELWILKGVQLGFTDIAEMEHLRLDSKRPENHTY